MNLLWNYSADLTSVNADLMSVNNVTENRLQKQFKNYWKTSLETYVRNSWISVISVTTTE